MKRVLATIFLFIAVLVAPWWVSMALYVACLFFFRSYVEGIFLFLIADLAYGIPLSRFHAWRFVEVSIALSLFLIIEGVKPYLLPERVQPKGVAP